MAQLMDCEEVVHAYSDVYEEGFDVQEGGFDVYDGFDAQKGYFDVHA